MDSNNNRDLTLALEDLQTKLLHTLTRSATLALTSQVNVNCERVAELFRTTRGENLWVNLQQLNLLWDRLVGPNNVPLFHTLIACQGMARTVARLGSLSLPHDVKRLIVQEYESNISSIRAGQVDQLFTRCDPPMAFLRSCFLQWIPVGVYYFEYSAIPKRNILMCPLRHKPALVWFLACRFKGLSPTIEMHLPPQPRGRFTEAESNRSHRLVAGVLAQQPAVKGIAGSSWYCDPEVLRISPHLSFVRELFARNGGFLHRLGPTKHSDRKALLKSETRRRLFEQGKYSPTDYARYWARRDVIQWANIENLPIS